MPLDIILFAPRYYYSTAYLELLFKMLKKRVKKSNSGDPETGQTSLNHSAAKSVMNLLRWPVSIAILLTFVSLLAFSVSYLLSTFATRNPSPSASPDFSTTLSTLGTRGHVVHGDTQATIPPGQIVHDDTHAKIPPVQLVHDDTNAMNQQNTQEFTVDFFLRTWRNDIGFLYYFLLSFEKFGDRRMFQKFIVSTLEEDRDYVSMIPQLFPALNITLIFVPQVLKRAYYDQMLYKFISFRYCDADYIFHSDSDLFFSQHVDMSNFIDFSGRPYLCATNFSNLAENFRVWQKPSSFLLKYNVEVETMTRHPFIYHRRTHVDATAHIEAAHGKPVEEVFLEGERDIGAVIEFSTLGGYAYYFQHDLYNWNCSWTYPVVQARSWSGFSSERIMFYACLLRLNDRSLCEIQVHS